MHWHWQNLTEDYGKKRAGLWHGRAWLHINRFAFQIEWTFGRYAHFCHIGINKDATEGEVGFMFAIPRLFSVFLSLGGMRLHCKNWIDAKRDFSVRIFDGIIWLCFWGNPDEWNHRSVRLHVIDWVFGKREYRRCNGHESRVHIPMPEKLYPATAISYVEEWRRARWPIIKRKKGITITPDEPIPHPGKGTSFWNLGEDALVSGSYIANNPEEAALKARDSIMYSREHYPS